MKKILYLAVVVMVFFLGIGEVRATDAPYTSSVVNEKSASAPLFSLDATNAVTEILIDHLPYDKPVVVGAIDEIRPNGDIFRSLIVCQPDGTILFTDEILITAPHY